MLQHLARRRFPLIVKVFLLIQFVFFVLACLSLLFLTENDVKEKNEKKYPKSIDKTYECKLPYIPITDEIIPMKRGNLNICTGLDLVEVKGDIAYIANETHAREYGKCMFRNIYRVKDHENVYGMPVRVKQSYRLFYSDFIYVHCTNSKNKQWENVLAGIGTDFTLRKEMNRPKVQQKSPTSNVMIFALDAISRNTFRQKLPGSYTYLREKLKAIELEWLTIVGDSPSHIFLPSLTGKTDGQLRNSKYELLGKYMDHYPFIWKKYQTFRYITGFAEDFLDRNVFSNLLKEFALPPVDHYIRPLYNEAERFKGPNSDFCLGSTPKHKIMLKYILDFFKMYENHPKFMTGFHSECLPTSNKSIAAFDDDFKQWLSAMLEDGHLKNTTFIILGDHGPRWSKYVKTRQISDERMPMAMVILPDWFQDLYPNRYNNLKNNSKMLTTPLDIYETLKDLLSIEDSPAMNLQESSISLMQSIPKWRTCDQAHIESHRCACMTESMILLPFPLLEKATEFILARINNRTAEMRHLCRKMEIYAVKKLRSYFYPAPFETYKFPHAFMSSTAANDTRELRVYQITFSIEPEYPMFEASITHELTEDKFYLNDFDINRIDRVNFSSQCLSRDEQYLNKYCYCQTQKNVIKNNSKVTLSTPQKLLTVH